MADPLAGEETANPKVTKVRGLALLGKSYIRQWSSVFPEDKFKIYGENVSIIVDGI